MSTPVGTPINVALPNSGDSGNIAITVPTGANSYAVSGVFYDGANTSVTSVSVGGVNGTLTTIPSTDYMAGYIASGTCSPGATNIRVQKAGFYSEGPTCQIQFFNADNPADLVRDVRCLGNANGPLTTSPALTTSAGDLVYVWSGGDGGSDLSGAISGVTQTGTEQTTNADKCRVYSATASGSSMTITGPSNSYAFLSAIVIKSSGGGNQILSPSLVTNTSTIYSPTVSQAPSGQVLSPTLVTNTQTFYSPSVSGMPDGARGQWIVDNTGPIGGAPAGILYNDVVLPGDANKWFHFVITTPPATGTLTIYPDGRFTFIGPNPETMYYQLYVDNVAVGSPQLVTLYDQSSTLLPPLVTNTSTIYSPAISLGPVSLNVPLLTNSSSIYSPTISLGGSTVSPPLVTNTSSIFAPTVFVSGQAVLQPPLLTNTSTIFAPVVGVAGSTVVSPPLLTNSQVFFSPKVTRSGDPPISAGGNSPKLALKMGIGL